MRKIFALMLGAVLCAWTARAAESGTPFTEGFERGLGSWSVTFADGAEGTYRPDDTQSRSGGNSLRLSKTNGKGYVDVKYSPPIRVEPGKTYMVECWYHAEDANVDNLGLIRVESGDGKLNYADKINSGEVAGTCSRLLNAAPFKWNKDVYFFNQEPGKENVFLHFVVRGNPCDVNLDDIAIQLYPHEKTMGSVKTYPRKAEEELFSAETARNILEKRTEPRVEIKFDGRLSRLFVDGKFLSPIIHHSPSGYPTVSRFREFEEAGIKLHTLGIRLGGAEPQKSIIQAKGKFDFRQADEDILRALRAAPNAYLLLDFYCGPYPGWGNETPDEVFQNAQGLKGISGNLAFVDRWDATKKATEHWYPSYYAETWRQELAECMTAYLAHLKTTPYLKAVAGFMITGGMDGQFMNNMIDYSPAARKGFVKWLKDKYGDEASFRRAWNSPDVTFANAAIPVLANNDSQRTFLNPATDARFADFQQFRSSGIADTLSFFAMTLKNSVGKNLPVFTKICDDLHASHIDTYSVYQMCAGNAIDGISPQPAYAERKEGAAPFNPSVVDSMRIHRKFNILEFDFRTYAGNEMPTTLHDLFISYAWTPESFRAINRKHAGMQIAKGMGFWYYDMGASYFYEKPVMEEIAATNRISDEVLAEPDSFKPDVALVFDETSVAWSAFRYYPMATFFNANAMSWYYQTSGVPYDVFFLKDVVDNPKLKDYKVFVFLNAYYMDRKTCDYIDQNLKVDGKTLVWCYGAGYLTEKGFSTEAVKELTGFQVGTSAKNARHAAEAVVSDDPLAKNLAPVLGLAESTRYSSDCPWNNFGETFDIQRFWLDDPEADVLAKYTADGKAAVGVRRFSDWTSVFVGPPAGLTAQLIHNIAAEAEAYTFSEPGLVANVKGNFASIHAVKGGTYNLKFPYPGRIVSLDDGKELAKDSDTLKIDINAGETRWYRVYRNDR